ncbi:DUF3955 domain-containing protein [Pantoea agglomerans]
MQKKIDAASSRPYDTGKTSILRCVWIITLALSIAIGIAAYFLHESTTWIDNEGVVHEPLFFLVLITLVVMFLGVALCLFDMFITFLKSPV